MYIDGFGQVVRIPDVFVFGSVVLRITRLTRVANVGRRAALARFEKRLDFFAKVRLRLYAMIRRE